VRGGDAVAVLVASDSDAACFIVPAGVLAESNKPQTELEILSKRI
jgi:hypothetical protein